MLTYFICMTDINFIGKKRKRMDNEDLILKLAKMDEEAGQMSEIKNISWQKRDARRRECGMKNTRHIK